MKRTAIVAAACAAGLALAACGNSNGGASTDSKGVTTVTYITTASVPDSTQIALYAVPTALGYFKKENLKVKIEDSSGSSAALQVIASGGALATNSEVVSTMAAIEKGVDVKTFGSINTSFPWQIAVPSNSSVKSPADLKGKSIGIISLASGSNSFTRSFLKENNIDPDKDVKLVPVGQGAQAKAALDSGKVQALALYAELYAQLESAGSSFRYLPNPPLFDGMPSIAFTARASSLDGSQRDVLVRYARAAYEGLLFSAVNPQAAVELGIKVFPQIAGTGTVTAADKANLLRQMKSWLKTSTPQSGDPTTWPEWGALSQASLNKAADYALSTGQVSKRPDTGKDWDGSLIADINKFDKAAIITQAKNYQSAS